MTGPGDLLLAVDLGGTKTAAALITAAGELALRSEQPTCQDGPEPLIAQIASMLHSLVQSPVAANRHIAGVGVGIPAVLEPETDFVIWGPNLSGWRNVDLRGALERMVGLPVFVEYDGHTAVLGEWWRGAARGVRSAAMIIAGTGIGGGLILDGRLYRGRDRLAGAAGWFAMTPDAGTADLHGRSIGHWESLAAGPGVARRAAALLPAHPESRLHSVSESDLSARMIFELARKGDALAERVVAETAELIGLGVANVVSLVNPEIVVLGGSIGRQPEILPVVRVVVNRWAQPASAGSVKICTSELGADAGLYGAAYAALSRMDETAEAHQRITGTKTIVEGSDDRGD